MTWVLIVLRFIMPRIKMRINGAEGGALFMYNESTTLEQLVQQAKIKLLTDEMERTAVVDENVILYLDGGERIRTVWRRFATMTALRSPSPAPDLLYMAMYI